MRLKRLSPWLGLALLTTACQTNNITKVYGGDSGTGPSVTDGGTGGTGGTGGSTPDAAVPVGTGTFCDAAALLVAQCSACHRPGGNFPDLTLAGLPALPGLHSQAHPDRLLIDPGHPENSLLIRKAGGTQAADEGGSMPPGATMDAAALDVLTGWVNDGAPTTCTGQAADGGSTPAGDGGADANLPKGDGLFCTAAPILVQGCSTCHRPGGSFPDLTVDGLAALPGLASQSHPERLLVDPGHPESSLLLRRMDGTQAADEGGSMPPAGALAGAAIDDVRAWIAGGAPTTCEGGVPDVGVGADATVGADVGLPVGDGPWCVASHVLVSRCAQCHNAQGNSPDLTAAAVANVVFEASATHPERPFIVPGLPAASLLYRKVDGSQAADEGGDMPPAGHIPAGELAALQTWIEAGAPTECAAPIPVPDAGVEPPLPDAQLPVGSGPFCDVAPVLVANCAGCHHPGGDSPDMTFPALPLLVGHASASHPDRLLVAPGDSAGSLVYRKIAGTQAADEGARMPARGPLSANDQALVDTWIAAGAPTTCDAVVPDAAVIEPPDAAPPVDAAPPAGDGPYCQIVPVLVSQCSGCHKPGGNYPDLTSAALPNLPALDSSAHPGRPLVVAGNLPGSLLYRKMAGTQAADEGARMPQNHAVTPAQLTTVADWIQAGLPTTCDVNIPDAGPPPPYHPVGYDAAAIHGLDLKIGVSDCRECHGARLDGGSGPSCDQCHQPGWRTDCTYCHGGTDTDTGAPPRDLRGAVAARALTFSAHTSHTTLGNHIGWDCNQCHTKPMDVLSVGHIFDATPGVSEVLFGGGLSRAGVYAGAGQCNNLYCHGNGRQNANYAVARGPTNCETCHPTAGLSPSHADHVDARPSIPCTTCHANTVDALGEIVDPVLHVNGVTDVEVSDPTIVWANRTCTGTCHDELHEARRW